MEKNSRGKTMIFKVKIGHWRFTFTFAPVTNIIGVNSNLQDGNHILMWDFDDIDLNAIEDTLRTVQLLHNLPNIYILTTGKKNHYIAYCFKRCSWEGSITIVADTVGVDPNFFKYGVYRGHWTLRVSPKEGRKPKLVTVLKGWIHEDCSIDELNSWTKYETLADAAPMRKWELKLFGSK
jgi:hypothetical protein